jgi:hypothetical protein
MMAKNRDAESEQQITELIEKVNILERQVFNIEVHVNLLNVI